MFDIFRFFRPRIYTVARTCLNFRGTRPSSVKLKNQHVELLHNTVYLPRLQPRNRSNCCANEKCLVSLTNKKICFNAKRWNRQRKPVFLEISENLQRSNFWRAEPAWIFTHCYRNKYSIYWTFCTFLHFVRNFRSPINVETRKLMRENRAVYLQ